MVPSTSDSGYTFTSKLHPPRGETQRDDGCGSSKISRKWFTDWLASWLDKDVIKVVTGIRRCGKTTLFELFREQLVESGRPCYFQVAYTVRDEATLARELAPLKSIRDNHPKFLLTLDNDPPLDHDGINRMNVVDCFLAPPLAGNAVAGRVARPARPFGRSAPRRRRSFARRGGAGWGATSGPAWVGLLGRPAPSRQRTVEEVAVSRRTVSIRSGGRPASCASAAA